MGMNLGDILRTAISRAKSTNDMYNVYADLMLKSEEAYTAGRMEQYAQLIEESNEAYEKYEYAAGLRSSD